MENAMSGFSEIQYIVLGIIVLAVLILPLSVRLIESNIEFFLLAAGGIAVSVSGVWTSHLIIDAVTKPLPITLAVLLFGLLFFYGRAYLDRFLNASIRSLPLPVIIFSSVAILGFLSSIVTAIVASLVLVEIVRALNLTRDREIRLVVLACFAIGLGAALTPVGEPLSTIVITQLHGDFFYLFRLLGAYLIPGIVFLGLFAAFIVKRENITSFADAVQEKTARTVWIRAGKVYAFVAALLMLGAGLMPLAVQLIAPLSPGALFWANMLSAILDNATLAAIEASFALNSTQLTVALLGILISGGMLIPGNIPNIIAADHLKIRSSEWARIGVPVGIFFMLVTFIVLLSLRVL
jgi:predicted cation transporter